jgi:hypothetical protein
MTLTPKQVIEELAKTGRHVEARTLTDWGARRLIPKPIEKGRGRGKGKSYFWTDDNILDRAALVADLPRAMTYAALSRSLGIFTKRQNGYTATELSA